MHSSHLAFDTEFVCARHDIREINTQHDSPKQPEEFKQFWRSNRRIDLGAVCATDFRDMLLAFRSGCSPAAAHVFQSTPAAEFLSIPRSNRKVCSSSARTTLSSRVWPLRLRLLLPGVLACWPLSTRSASMESHEALMSHLTGDGWLTDPHCIAAMNRVDRANYINRTVPRSLAYLDRPLPNGPTETISAPHMHATAMQLLADKLKPGARVLDVGSGSGYLTACFGYAVHPGGYVLGVEKFADLADSSLDNLRAADGELLDDGTVEIRSGNALGDVYQARDRFDAIHVGAAADEMPSMLLAMLDAGGKMIVPVGRQGNAQVLMLVERAADGEDEPQFKFKKVMHVQYVPLTAP